MPPSKKKKNVAPPSRTLWGDTQPTPPDQQLAPQADAGTAMTHQRQELIDNLLDGRLTGEIKILPDGTMKIRAQDDQGAIMTLTSYTNDRTGYREGGFTALPRKLSPTERREEASRLAATGLTQQAIAERLGVSQKTVSNDIKKP